MIFEQVLIKAGEFLIHLESKQPRPDSWKRLQLLAKERACSFSASPFKQAATKVRIGIIRKFIFGNAKESAVETFYRKFDSDA